MLDRAPLGEPSRLERLWRRELPWRDLLPWLLLLPLAGLYACALGLRALFWRTMRRRAGTRVVSVGNLVVGGSGKTPFTVFVARKLAERGLRVGIVSRGYGGHLRERAAMVSDGTHVLLPPEQAGDEPVMMAKVFGGPVAVARRRIDGVELLQRKAQVDIALLDDGFQHLRLERDFDLLLVNTDRGLGNGWLLPAGPMREPLSAARRAHAVILIGRGAESGALSSRQRARLGQRPIFDAIIRPRCLVHAEFGRWRESPIALVGRRVLAVSGLADAGSFYEMIREQDAELVGVLEYGDHHEYTNSDWQAIAEAAQHAEIVLTTEKDLVKLERFPFPRDSLYALRLEVWMDERESARLLDMIAGVSNHPRQAALA
jgi:tetraacyldisaccharide 4'-kinase